MKKEFPGQPEHIRDTWPGELREFSWQDFVTAIPTPIFLVTSYKSNGRENATLASWSTFVGNGGEFLCILGAVKKSGHLYASLMDKRCCVLNFPSAALYGACYKTIQNNGFDCDELTESGLAVEPAVSVNAPRARDCFLNIECEFLWAHDQFEGGAMAVVALRAKHIAMDSDRYDDARLGRYGKTGYIYNIHSPRNPDTGEESATGLGYVTR